jgi:LysM repeat protein
LVVVGAEAAPPAPATPPTPPAPATPPAPPAAAAPPAQVEAPEDGVYVVKSGDTVSTIAERFGLKSAELRELNNLADNTIRVGQKLMVGGAPASSPAPGPAPAAQAPRASAAVTVTSALSPPAPPAPASPPASASAAPAADEGFYVVQSGDTVSAIAGRFGLKSAQLREINNLAPDATIRVGQRLKVGGGGAPAASAGASSGETYVVHSGDPVSTIAERFGMRSAELRELNGLAGDGIRVGQRLEVASGRPRRAASAGAGAVSGDIYEVKSGDTVSAIATRFGLKSSELRELNQLANDSIRVGQKLKIRR